MSYIAGDSSATVNKNMSDLYIFDSAEGSSYDHQPYAKILTMSGGAAVTYTGVTLSSGGTAIVAANTLLRDVHIYSGGSASLKAGANLGGLTIESGGRATSAGNSLVFSNFTIKAGGYLYTNNANLYGRNNFVAAGTLAGYLSVASDSVDGVLCGVTQTGGAYRYGDIVFSNFVNNGNAFTYMKSGCSILNASAINANGGFAFEGGGYLYNAYVTNGKIWTQMAGVAVSLGGAETQITQGHWYHCGCNGTTKQDTNLYAANGVLYGVTLKTDGVWLRNLTIVSGLTISAPNVNNTGKLVIADGGIAATASVADGGRIEVLSGGTATGITATDGAAVLLTVAADTVAQGTKNGSAFSIAGPVVDTFEANNGVTLVIGSGGSGNAISVLAGGGLYVEDNANATNVTVAAGGILNGFAWNSDLALAALPNGTATIADNQILELNKLYVTGVVDGVTVISGGSMIVSSGATVGNVTVNAGATVAVSSGGKVGTAVVNGVVNLAAGGSITEEITVENGGSAELGPTAISGLVVKNGGSASATTNGITFYGGITVEAGGHLHMSTCTISGNMNVAAGTLSGLMTVASDSVDGVACGITQTAGAFHYRYTPLSNYVVNGKAYCYLHDGATVSNGSATYAQGGFAFCSGGYLYNAQVTNGWIWVHEAGAPVSLGGAETNITKGNWYHCNAGGSASKDNNLYAEDGVLYDATIKNNGRWLRNLTVLSGLTISRAVMSSGGSLTLVSGGIGNELTVSGYGRLYVSNGGVATSAQGTGGMYVYEGGIINSATVKSTGALHVSNGGVANNAAVNSGGKMYISAGGKVNGLVVSTGELNADHAVFTGTAEGTDISIYGGKNSGQYCVKVSGGAVVSKVYQSGGGLWVYNNGTVKELEVVKGEMVFEGDTYGSDVKVSGGTAILYVRNNALVENLHMSGAEARFAAGTIRNASFEGTIGQLKISTGFLMESASFYNGAVMSVCSGGSLNSATVNSHAVILVSKGAEVSNVVVNGDDWDGRFKIYDGGHVSGLTLNGTKADRNYVIMSNGSGVLEDVTTDKAGIYLASGGIIRNVTQKNGAYVILRGENPYASGANVLGGTLFFQNGAKGQDIVVNGGNMQVVDDAYAVEVKGSGAKVSGVDLVTGTINISAGGELYDVRVSGGTVNVTSKANYGLTKVSGALMTGGQIKVSSGAAVFDTTINDGRLWGLNGGTISGATLNGGELYILDSNTASETELTDRAAIIASDVDVNGGQIFWRGSNASGADIRISGGGTHYIQNAAHVSGMVMYDGIMNLEVNAGAHPNDQPNNPVLEDFLMAGGIVNANNYARINDAALTGGTLNVNNGAVVTALEQTGGKLMVYGGGTANDVTITENGSAVVSGTLNVATSAWNVQVNNGGVVSLDANETLGNAKTVAGAHVNYKENKSGATIKGAETNIAASTFYYNGATVANGFSVENGVVRDLGADGNVYRIGIGDGITVEDAEVFANCRISAFGGAVVSGVNIVATTTSASVIMRDDSEVYNANLTGGTYKAVINLYENAKAEGVTINAGGKVGVSGAAMIENTTIKAGGQLVISAGCPDVDTGDRLTLDFTGTTGNQSVSINDLGSINAKTEIVLKGETAPETGSNTYTIATTGSTDKYVNCGEWGLYDDSIKANETITNAFTSMTYAFNATGTAIEVTAFEAAAQSEAGSIEGGTTINTNGKAAKWTQNTTTGGSGSIIKAATSAIAGDAWLEIDGTNLTDTTLYGAETGFTGGVNLYALNDAVVNNLAAGAEAGGTVESVKLTVEDATVGLAYAGGFGNVTSKTETLISGATVLKDFYAGALANYAKTGNVTSAGDITLEIADGEFSGNIYGAASVKAGAATSLVHSVGNVTITVKDGETKKGTQACLFAGGYATGSAASDSAVYTVNNIDVTIDGGSWGAAAGGRGVFGGIFASKVTAVAEDVTITINGGTFGNVYGGGWAQQGGVSVVDDVNITIDGGTIANVFGGGTHSTSGGSTTVDDVSINISGGTITGDIFARGQADGDSVTGDEVNVTFTGDTNFGCGVFGYSYVGGAASDAVLSYTAYTGTFSGKIGGFDSIVFDDDTAMTLSTAADDVTNSNWEFDFTDRADTLSATSFLTWSTADFAGDTVKVNFTDAAQAAAGWNIADAAFTGATFDLYIGGDKIAEGIAYDTAIADGDWAGWKFTDENGTLKFAQITA